MDSQKPVVHPTKEQAKDKPQHTPTGKDKTKTEVGSCPSSTIKHQDDDGVSPCIGQEKTRFS